jgi:hypothetical protein
MFSLYFFQFWVIKTLDPYPGQDSLECWIRIWIKLIRIHNTDSEYIWYVSWGKGGGGSPIRRQQKKRGPLPNSNALEHFQTTTHTLILAYTESSFSHKISCPSHLVKEQGVGLYSDPTPIYFYLF